MRRLHVSIFASALLAIFMFATAAAQPDKAKGGKGDLDSDPESASGTPPSKMFTRAIGLYKKEDYYSASIELKKVLDGDTDDDASNKERAQFFMGKTLYQMGFYAGALNEFEKITKAGDKHGYYVATLKWLAALSRVLPDASQILEKIGKYDAQLLEGPGMEGVRDELYFLLGRQSFNKGNDKDLDDAITLFGKVAESSEFFVKAKFFEGVTYVRKSDGRNAGESFKKIFEIAQERPKQYRKDDIERFQELAILQMARTFYSTQNFDKAIRYYEKLEQSSPEWATSLFEASWAYFRKTNNPKALGNIHTLNAPYFENEFFPESLLLKSVIYFNYCQYDRALEAVGEYNAKYRPLRENLAALVKKFDDNAEFYDHISKQIKPNKANLDPQTQRLVMSVLGDKTLAKTFAWVDELDKEIGMLVKADKAWQTTAVAGEVNTELEVRKSIAQADAGRLAKDRITRLIRELAALDKDGKKIKYEVLNARAGKISVEGKGERISASHKDDPIIVDDEHFVWRFNGEYWKDELGYYRFKVRSQCPKT